MAQHPASLLSWITDYIYAPYVTLGSLCNVTPAHHIIMTNALSDCDQGPARKQQETYDLKPIDYFYPELDLFPDPLVGKNVMDKLADVFEDKIRVSGTDYQELRKELDADTWFLKQVNAVDYSLFLIRGPAESGSGDTTGGKHGRGSGRASRWREGVRSVDGNWWYRVVVLDFFWAKHTLRAQAMTGAVQMFNVIAHKEPMTITTTAWEYREKFLHMVDSLVEVHEA